MDHKSMAVECFNTTWDLIDKTDRTGEDNLVMLHTAHASAFHWRQVGTPLNFARSEWQVSRVCWLIGQFESALYHARESLRICEENTIADFDLAFAFEACARAYSALENGVKLAEYRTLALEACEKVAKPEDREYVRSEIGSIPGINS